MRSSLHWVETKTDRFPRNTAKKGYTIPVFRRTGSYSPISMVPAQRWLQGNLERGRWGPMTVPPPPPPRGKGVDVSSHLCPDKSVANASSGSPPSQVLPTSLLPAPPSSPTRRQGRGTSRDTSLLCPSLSPDGDGPGPLYCLGSDLDLHQVTSPDTYPGLSADQPGMPEACCCVFLKGLRWQGGSLERGCLAHREIAG